MAWANQLGPIMEARHQEGQQKALGLGELVTLLSVRYSDFGKK